ncbi:hypothetical protein GLYMA_18G182700v4 [Glycine max]|uniref:Uncharacterized protein n=1 Tax=Glycine max TaxID=3847 RepID=K7MT50_SOYBN|nr:hypothetical protein GYH30_050366 [Glycine max]KRG99978.1 hypothetical protein GLYMA_18G182700v4 [Glycine max]
MSLLVAKMYTIIDCLTVSLEFYFNPHNMNCTQNIFNQHYIVILIPGCFDRTLLEYLVLVFSKSTKT